MSKFVRFMAKIVAMALLLATGVLATPLSSYAQESGAKSGIAATPAGHFIQDLGEKAVSILGNKTMTPADRDHAFRKMLRDSFDLTTIGRFVIGRNWLAATPAQQQEYMKLFEALVVKTYSDRFALYTGEGFHVTAVQAEGDSDFVVNSEITHPDGSPATSVDWRLRQKDGKLGIVDVIVEGVSMRITQRQEYASVIERNGGNIDGLLEVMRQRLNGVAPAPVAAKG